MKASVQYNDLKGTAAADIADHFRRGSLEDIGEYFNLDTNRFKIVGISLHGTEDLYISLICVDKEKSTNEKEHIVDIYIDNKDKKGVLSTIFKRLNIVLHNRHDVKYTEMECDEEVSYDDCHNTDNGY